MGRTRFAATMLLVSLYSSWGSGAETITVDELAAGFRYNRSLLKSPRIQIQRSNQWKEGWRGYAAKTANDSERLANSGDLDEAKQKSLRQGAMLLRQAANSDRPMNLFVDYWTNWKSFHARTPSLAPEVVPNSWTFPDTSISPENLVSDYRDYIICSFDPQASPRCRVWNGVRGDGERSGRVTDKSINEVVSSFQFPPLGVQDPHWAPTSIWHPIDQFFEDYEKGAVVTGQVKLNDRNVFHVRHIAYVDAPNGFAKSSGKFEIATIVEAWIDPERGFLPLKIEWHSGIYHDRKPIVVTRTPHKQLETTEIKLIDGAGYYPVTGMVRDFVDDPNWKESSISIDDVVKGATAPDPPKLLNTEFGWDLMHITPNAELTEEMVKLEFPTSTNFYDESRQRVMIQGLSEDEVDRMLAADAKSASVQQGGSTPGPRSGRWWLVILNVGLVAIVIGVYYWRSRR